MFTINKFKLTPLKIPLEKPLLQKNGVAHSITILLLDIDTIEGIAAQSFIYGIGDKHYASTKLFVDELMACILYKKFDQPTTLWHTLWQPHREKISSGLGLYALALIDIAC